ncbi:hypothetical protein COU53_00510 [Candidatus Pacearchaeota archaeon CG10_big_fil_rev_8_21_14_0_10_30_48]|nr:MAG: hypothetical protein COU53_00510 [Candidatus Pacearchaeota archaeon CG10_big_fil_rev_8_21_14_0_10_30_48]
MLQLIKGFSSRILFLIYPQFRDVYPRGHFWNAGYFCTNVGEDYDRVFDYVKNQ